MTKIKRNILAVEDILDEEELKEFHSRWSSFKTKYKNSEYNNKNNPLKNKEVHSEKPVIGRVFKFDEHLIFRSYVFSNRLRDMDPYFITGKYVHPFWHLVHYLTVAEQMYHASAGKIRNTDRLCTKEYCVELELSQPIFWRDRTFIQLILEPKRESEKYSIEDCYFTFYDDNSDKIKGTTYARTITELRDYVKCINALRQNDGEAMEKLIKKIEIQDILHKKLINPRKTLMSTPENLIERLKSREIPEEEIHDFFSLWDK